jgi:hypothetical protein
MRDTKRRDELARGYGRQRWSDIDALRSPKPKIRLAQTILLLTAESYLDSDRRKSRSFSRCGEPPSVVLRVGRGIGPNSKLELTMFNVLRIISNG